MVHDHMKFKIATMTHKLVYIALWHNIYR